MPCERLQRIAAKNQGVDSQSRDEGDDEEAVDEEEVKTEADIQLSPEEYKDLFDEAEQVPQDVDPIQQEFFDRLAESDEMPEEYADDEPYVDSDGDEWVDSDEEDEMGTPVQDGEDPTQTFSIDDVITSGLDPEDDPEGPFI
jgi:hypothetical protein